MKDFIMSDENLPFKKEIFGYKKEIVNEWIQDYLEKELLYKNEIKKLKESIKLLHQDIYKLKKKLDKK